MDHKHACLHIIPNTYSVTRQISQSYGVLRPWLDGAEFNGLPKPMGDQGKLLNLEIIHDSLPFNWLFKLCNFFSLLTYHRVHDWVFKNGNCSYGVVLYAMWWYCFSFQRTNIQQPFMWKLLCNHGLSFRTHGSSDSQLDCPKRCRTIEIHFAICDNFPIHNIPPYDCLYSERRSLVYRHRSRRRRWWLYGWPLAWNVFDACCETWSW